MAEVQTTENEKLNFFGEIDRNYKGQVTSEMPAWYFETHLMNLKEERDSAIRRLDRGEIPLENQPYARAEIQSLTEQIEQIEQSRPNIKDNERDKLLKYRQELTKKIEESMFTYSEMMRGTANAHEEARRMVDKLIPLSPPLRSMATACNVEMSKDFKVSRNGATKIWKIVGKLLGMPTNVEGLRRDNATVITGA